MVSAFKVNSRSARFGVVQYSDGAEVMLRLTQSKDEKQVIKAVEQVS